ncbi:MAG: glycosyltransferase family 4 protein [Desulfobacteraceae bacterium]
MQFLNLFTTKKGLSKIRTPIIPMKILFLSHYFPPEVNAPASRTYEHAKYWVQECGVSVSVITNHPNHPRGVLYPGYENRWFTKEEMDGIEIQRVKTYLAPNSGFRRRILNYLFYMVAAVIAGIRGSKPDVLVATSPQFFCAVAGYLLSKIKRCPFVFELRDLWPESIVAVGAMRPGMVLRIIEKLELCLYRHSDLIIALTDAFKKNLIKRGVPAANIRVIKNGVDLSFFSPRGAPEALKVEIGTQGKFVVTYIGTIGMAHAIDKIVAVAEQLKNNNSLLFLIVGEGSEKDAIQELIQYKGIQNIKVLPGVSKDQVRDYYALSDINLVTLKKAELFGTVIPSKIFEIMAMARPILSTVDGECRQIIEEAGSGIFVEPENVKQMATILLKLSKQPDILEAMSQNGRRFVERYFSRTQLAHHYLELLKDCFQYSTYS